MDEFDVGQILSTSQFAQALTKVLPFERLVVLSANNPGQKLQPGPLYALNLRISANLWVLFHLLEVLLRNALSDQLLRMYPDSEWWTNPNIFRTQEANHIINATKKSIRRKGTVSKGDVIANLNFGFWTILLSGPYHQKFWERGFAEIFHEYKGTRKQIFNSLERLRKLRNRIAHHEPILNRYIQHDFELLLQLLKQLGFDYKFPTSSI